MMPPTIARLLLATAALLAAAPFASADRLTFLNGDRIRGTLAGADDTGHLLWSNAPGETPARFPIAAIHKVEIEKSCDVPASDQDVSLALSNGDTLHGKLLSLAKGNVEIESPAFGRLQIPRLMLDGLNVNEGGYFLLPDAGKARDWFVDNKGSWKVSGGVLRGTDFGTLGRDLPRASRIRMDFDITTDNSGGAFTVHLFAANAKSPAQDNNYAIQFNGSYVYARKSMREEAGGGLFGRGGAMNTETLGDAEHIERGLGSRPAHLAILSDAGAGIIILQVDGKTIQRWTDSRGFGDKYGGAIGFANNGQSTVISNLTVARWNGEEASGQNAPDSPSTTDAIFLGNDDMLTGKITGLSGGKLDMEAENFGKLSIPSARVVRIKLAGNGQEQARRLSGDVIAQFRSGGRLTLRLDTLDADSLSGFSENYGQAKIATRSLRELVFNLYTEKYPAPESLSNLGPDAILRGQW